MISRENKVVGVCAFAAIAILLVGVEFEIDTIIIVAAVVIVGAVLPQVVNNYLHAPEERK